MYFDDFHITHTPGPVVQQTDYYPFGMQHSSSWTRLTTLKNNFLYNAGSELNEETKNYETFYRNYDPALGRFTAIDPLASRFSNQTPYQFANNDPVYYNDPNGDYGRGRSVQDEIYMRNYGMFHYESTMHYDGFGGGQFGGGGDGFAASMGAYGPSHYDSDYYAMKKAIRAAGGVIFLHVLFNDKNKENIENIIEGVAFARGLLESEDINVNLFIHIKFGKEGEGPLSKKGFANDKMIKGENDKYVVLGSVKQLRELDDDENNGWARHGGSRSYNWWGTSGTSNNDDPISYLVSNNIFRLGDNLENPSSSEKVRYNNSISEKFGIVLLHEPGHQWFKDHSQNDRNGHIPNTIMQEQPSSNTTPLFDQEMLNILWEIYGKKR